MVTAAPDLISQVWIRRRTEPFRVSGSYGERHRMRGGSMAEPDDFAAFVSSSSYRLFRAAALLTGGDLATAEDLVADALARVYLAWPRIRSEDAFAYARR